jgi:hypothetical protein
MAFNHLTSRTLKNTWKLWVGAKMHSTILPTQLDCVYIHLACQRSNSYTVDSLSMMPRVSKHTGVANQCTQLSELCITGMVEKTGKHYCCYSVPILIFTLNKF